MQNIVIVCADKDLRKDVSKVLGEELGFLYVDVDDILDYELLNNQDVTLNDAKHKLKELEQKSIKRALEFKNCIITMSRDLFVSNDNFLMLAERLKVFLSISKSQFVARFKNRDRYTLEQEVLMFDKVDKLIELNCDFKIENTLNNINEISEKIIKKIK